MKNTKTAATSGRIRYAPVEKVTAFVTENDAFCKAMVAVVGKEPMLITDLSSVWDFDDGTGAVYRQLEEVLGVPVYRADTVLEVFRRMREKRVQEGR